MNHFELESKWIDDELDVKYSFDDFVEILNGERAGEVGRIVSLWMLSPEPTYMIEFADGTGVSVAEKSLTVANRPPNAVRSKLILKQL